MDPRIRIRIHTKMSWIRNTAYKNVVEVMAIKMTKQNFDVSKTTTGATALARILNKHGISPIFLTYNAITAHPSPRK
jgi:hypothetical protein